MRVQTNRLHSKRFYEELDSFAALYGVREDDNLAPCWEFLEVIDDVCDSLVLSLSESYNLFKSFWQKQK